MEHVIEYFPNLLKKWEETKAHCNMVIAMSCGNQKKDEKVDVQVVTQGGVKMGMELEHDESSGQKSKGKIRKAVSSPPKFDVTQHK
jgi:hypothetical protein